MKKRNRQKRYITSSKMLTAVLSMVMIVSSLTGCGDKREEEDTLSTPQKGRYVEKEMTWPEEWIGSEVCQILKVDEELHLLLQENAGDNIQMQEWKLNEDGSFTEGYMIESITSPDGEVVYEHEPVKNEVFKDSTAYLMSDMLKESFVSGSAYHIDDFYRSIENEYDFAAKTGTSNSCVDSWFMGYNPDVTLGLWMGCDENIPQVSGYEGEQYLHIYNWRNLTQELIALAPDQMGRGASFQQPDSVRQMEYCGLTMESESDCETDLDQPIEGLVAEDTRISDKSSLNDPAIQSRMGAAFDDEGLSNSSLRGTVTNTYDNRYSVGGSSSSDDDDDDDDD